MMNTHTVSFFLRTALLSIISTRAINVQPTENTFELTREALNSTQTALRATEIKAEEESVALQSERSASHAAALSSDAKVAAQARELARRDSQVAAAEAEVAILTQNSRRYADLARDAQTALAANDRELNATKVDLAAETEELGAAARENSIRLQSVQTRSKLEDADERERLGNQIRLAQGELQAFNATNLELARDLGVQPDNVTGEVREIASMKEGLVVSSNSLNAWRHQFVHNAREFEETKSQLMIAQRRASMADFARRSLIKANAELNSTKSHLAQAVSKAQRLKAVQEKLAVADREVVVFRSAMIAKAKELNATRDMLASFTHANTALAVERASLAANLGYAEKEFNLLHADEATKIHELNTMHSELAAAQVSAEILRNTSAKLHVAEKEVTTYSAALQMQRRKLATARVEEVEAQRLRAASAQVAMHEFWELEATKSNLRQETSSLAEVNATLRMKDAELRLARSESLSNASALLAARSNFEKKIAAEDNSLQAAAEEEARLRAANDTTRKLSMLRVATAAQGSLRAQLTASNSELAEARSQAHTETQEVTELKGRISRAVQTVADQLKTKDDAVAAELTKRDEQQWATELRLNATQQDLDTVRRQLAELAPAAREQMEDDEAKGRELTKTHAQLTSKDREIDQATAWLQAAQGRMWAEEAELNRTRAAARSLAQSGAASDRALHNKDAEVREELLLAKAQIQKAQFAAAVSERRAAAAEAREAADVAALKKERAKEVHFAKKIKAEYAEDMKKIAAEERKASELEARNKVLHKALKAEVHALRGRRGGGHGYQYHRRQQHGIEAEKADF